MRIVTIINDKIRSVRFNLMNFIGNYFITSQKIASLQAVCNSFAGDVVRLKREKLSLGETVTDLTVSQKNLEHTLLTCQEELMAVSSESQELKNENVQLKKNVECYSLKDIYSLSALKQKWFKATIEDIDTQASEGCGLYYELYEERRQNMLTSFLKRNKEALTDEEIKQFKIDANYIDDFEPYSEYDAELGHHVSIHEMIQQEMV